jgi:drug/metabolite transporter (DMT)-like permease
MKGTLITDVSKPHFLPQYHTMESVWLLGGCATFGLLAWFSCQLFRLYERGQLFDPHTIGYLRKIAWTTFLMAIETGVAYALWNPAQPKPEISTWSAYLTLAFPAFLIFFFAWIMDEGRKIQEEQELTV